MYAGADHLWPPSSAVGAHRPTIDRAIDATRSHPSLRRAHALLLGDSTAPQQACVDRYRRRARVSNVIFMGSCSVRIFVLFKNAPSDCAKKPSPIAPTLCNDHQCSLRQRSAVALRSRRIATCRHRRCCDRTRTRVRESYALRGPSATVIIAEFENVMPERIDSRINPFILAFSLRECCRCCDCRARRCGRRASLAEQRSSPPAHPPVRYPPACPNYSRDRCFASKRCAAHSPPRARCRS